MLMRTYWCGMEWCELDAVAVDFPYVEIFANFGDMFRGYVVCGAPDAFGGFVLDGVRWDESWVEEVLT
jgi:hypothetical protein